MGDVVNVTMDEWNEKESREKNLVSKAKANTRKKAR